MTFRNMFKSSSTTASVDVPTNTKSSKSSSSSSVSSKSATSSVTKSTSKKDCNSTSSKKLEGKIVTTTTKALSIEDLLEQQRVLPHAHVTLRCEEEMKFHCQSSIAAEDINYSIVSPVVDSWEQDVKAIANWDQVLGETLLRKMFELEPECIEMFGFPADTKHDDPVLSLNKKFLVKGATFIRMLDMALSFVGPDLEPLQEQLYGLGGRHVSRQCKPEHFPMNGVALHHALQKLLGDKFTTDVQNGWIILFNFFGYHMIQGLIAKGGPTWEDNTVKVEALLVKQLVVPHVPVTRQTEEEMKFHCRSSMAAQDIKYSIVSPVVDLWEQDVKVIANWDQVLGETLLRKMFEMEPECITMFGFPVDTKHDDPALSLNKKFLAKGATFIRMLDMALSLVGPDLEPLQEQLYELGGRHVSRQCKPKHFPMNGVALQHALQKLLGDKFTTDVQNGWVILFNFFGYHMIQGLIAKGGPTWDDN